MKKNLLFCALILIVGNTSYAKIWRVNNTGVPADFTTAQLANDNASVLNGDTLHFEPSASGYGTLSLNKQLVIIGNGYFLGSIITNSNPDLQANTAVSGISSLSFAAGSNNSVIMGMTFTNAYISNVNNLLFRRNRVINNLFFASQGSSNVQVTQCYIDGLVNQQGIHTNLLMANNIFVQGISFDINVNGTFQNNVFHTSTAGYSSSFYNFTLRSNILAGGGLITFVNSLVENNIGNSTQFGTASGNQSNVTMSTVFVGYPTIGTNSFDGRYQLQNPGPAIGTGYGGVDCGAYGNTPAYVKSGIPNVPSIYKLSVPPIVTNNILNVTLSTKVNQ